MEQSKTTLQNSNANLTLVLVLHYLFIMILFSLWCNNISNVNKIIRKPKNTIFNTPSSGLFIQKDCLGIRCLTSNILRNLAVNEQKHIFSLIFRRKKIAFQEKNWWVGGKSFHEFFFQVMFRKLFNSCHKDLSSAL